jgi:putative transposase
VAIASKQRFFPTCYGIQFTRRAILKWADENAVPWPYIDPGKPQQNAFIDSLTGSQRDALLNEEIYDSRDDARRRSGSGRCRRKTARPEARTRRFCPEPGQARAPIVARCVTHTAWDAISAASGCAPAAIRMLSTVMAP